MKKAGIIILLIFLKINSTGFLHKNNMTDVFFSGTVDEFYWKEIYYMCSKSPLASLTGYRSVYKEYGDCHISYGIPMIKDKNYTAYWTIIDSMLYLFDVRNTCALLENDDDKLNLDNIEKFLNVKFSKDNLSEFDKKNERFKNGVILAIWFTGSIYIKRYPKEGEASWEDEYRFEKYGCLTFDKGRLIKEMPKPPVSSL